MKTNERQTMKTISTQARMTSLLLALITTVVVLGSTAAGMQISAEAQPAVVVMDKITIKPTTLQ